MMVIIRLHIKLPQMIGYVKYFDSDKTMSFRVSDEKLLNIKLLMMVMMPLEYIYSFLK